MNSKMTTFTNSKNKQWNIVVRMMVLFGFFKTKMTNEFRRMKEFVVPNSICNHFSGLCPVGMAKFVVFYCFCFSFSSFFALNISLFRLFTIFALFVISIYGYARITSSIQFEILFSTLFAMTFVSDWSIATFRKLRHGFDLLALWTSFCYNRFSHFFSFQKLWLEPIARTILAVGSFYCITSDIGSQ
jgi:hypothetical protein